MSFTNEGHILFLLLKSPSSISLQSNPLLLLPSPSNQSIGQYDNRPYNSVDAKYPKAQTPPVRAPQIF